MLGGILALLYPTRRPNERFMPFISDFLHYTVLSVVALVLVGNLPLTIG